MTSPTEARLALRQAVAGVKDRLAYRQDAIVGLAGDGNGNVDVAGTGLILVRTMTGGRVLLAHNPSGQIFNEGELVEAIPLDDRAPLGYRVAGRSPAAELYALYIHASGSSIYRFIKGSAIDIGSPPITQHTHELNDSQVSWMDYPASAIVDGILHILPGFKRYSGSATFPGPLAPPDGFSQQGTAIPWVRYWPGVGWIEQALPWWTLSPATQIGTIAANLWQLSNLAVDIYNDVYVVYHTGLNFFSGGRTSLWKMDRSISSPVLVNELPNYPTASPANLYYALIAAFGCFQRSEQGTPALAFGFGHGMLAPSTNIYRADIVSSNTSDLASGQFPTAGTLDGFNRALPIRTYEAAWRVGNTHFICRRDQVYTCTGDPTLTWAVAYALTGATDSLTYRQKVGTATAVWGWLGSGEVNADPNRLLPIAGQLIPGLPNPHNALTYHGPASLGSLDTVYTLFRVDAAGATAIWTVVQPDATSGRPRQMVQSGGNLYVSVAAGTDANGNFNYYGAFTNTYIDAGIYEVNTTSGAVRQIIGTIIGTTPGGWYWLCGDQPRHGIQW